MGELYDVIIVGGGPAGLTAALYLARAKYRVLVLEKLYFGGQIAITEEVVNYPGVARISGRALTDTMRAQAEVFGAEFRLEEAVDFDFSGDVKTVRTEAGAYRCFGILLATGAHPRTVGFQGEEEYKGRGVAYCATCDGEFFTGKEIFVVGGGYAAAEESVFLTKFAWHVTVLVRKGDFSCAASVAEKAKNHEKITVLTNTILEEVSGEGALTYARYKNTATGQVTEYRARSGDSFGVFVFAGYAPDTALFRDRIACNDQGYILTDGALKTNIDGVYAAGDVCIKPLRQVVTATGDGALAATELEKYAAAMQEKTGLRPEIPAKEIKTPEKSERNGLIDGEMGQQLRGLFDKMEQNLVLELYRNEEAASGELERLMEELVSLTDRLTLRRLDQGENGPFVRICRQDGGDTGLSFHGVPGGHEFTPFALGLYNAAGPGQPLDEELRRRIRAIGKPVEMKIFVTLSCNMCPELVTAAQRIAAENPNISAGVYDLRYFPQLREKYRVMSVPCLVIDGERVHFGKKNIGQILELLEQ